MLRSRQQAVIPAATDDGTVGAIIRAADMAIYAEVSGVTVIAATVGLAATVETMASAPTSVETARSVATAVITASAQKHAADVTEVAIDIAVQTGVATRIGVSALRNGALTRTHKVIAASVAKADAGMQIATGIETEIAMPPAPMQHEQMQIALAISVGLMRIGPAILVAPM